MKYQLFADIKEVRLSETYGYMFIIRLYQFSTSNSLSHASVAVSNMVCSCIMQRSVVN